MTARWQAQTCEQVQAYYSFYPVPVAAALWCDIPAEEVDQYLGESTQVGRAIFRHPYIPCLEPRCRAIHSAIESGKLTASRENGKPAADHISPERRHVSRADLKKFVSDEFPADKPSFLFDEIERNAHPSISAADFTALKAAYDLSERELEKAKRRIAELEGKLEQRNVEYQQLQHINNSDTFSRRSKTTLLNITGGLIGLMLGKTPAGRDQSIYINQSAIIEALVTQYPNIPGISKRTLEEKFALAKNSLSN